MTALPGISFMGNFRAGSTLETLDGGSRPAGRHDDRFIRSPGTEHKAALIHLGTKTRKTDRPL
jgi:hypothetical protein